MKRLILAVLAIFMIGCSSGETTSIQPTTTDTSGGTEPMSEYGDLIIKDIPFLYFEMGKQKIDITFTKPEFAEEIKYTYQSTLFKIEDDYIVPLKSGMTTAYVTAETSHHSVRFKVNMPGTASTDRYDRAVSYAGEIKSKVDDDTTVFLGDSFFDVVHFWKNFYTEVTGNRYICGISSSTIVEWGLYASLIFKEVNPKYVVFHIGSNDFWDSKREVSVVKDSFEYFMNYVHSLLPNSKIIICSVENRSYKMPQFAGMDDTIKVLKEYDSFVREYVNNNSYIGYIDSISHFCNADWTIKTELTKDGTHPANSEYNFYVTETKKFGADIDMAS